MASKSFWHLSVYPLAWHLLHWLQHQSLLCPEQTTLDIPASPVDASCGSPIPGTFLGRRRAEVPQRACVSLALEPKHVARLFTPLLRVPSKANISRVSRCSVMQLIFFPGHKGRQIDTFFFLTLTSLKTNNALPVLYNGPLYFYS